MVPYESEFLFLGVALRCPAGVDINREKGWEERRRAECAVFVGSVVEGGKR